VDVEPGHVGVPELTTEVPAYAPDDEEGVELFYRRYGFAVLRGLVGEADLAQIEAECRTAQERLMAGELPERYGTAELVEGDAGEKVRRFANYVTHVTELSPAADAVFDHPSLLAVMKRWLGPQLWSARDGRFGFVYQDARPSKESSYSRIGWHSDWQSAPHLGMWPATAVTVHLDATSPENGFLRVVPGSQMWATPAPFENVNGAVVPDGAAPSGGYGDEPPPAPMPLGFEKVRGEAAVYLEAGDVLLHDCYLWHSAARATVESSVRRHLRGSWYGGARPVDVGPRDFVKNAAR
jgi:ectoine hydroxylase-related dioxygenase (phytanoyl-CoA dioxygenase family)